MKSRFLMLQAGTRRPLLVAAAVLALFLPARWAGAQSPVTFDFDTGTPVLAPYENVPLDQISGGVTAHFSSPSGAAFSIQTDTTSGLALSQFSGQYLYPNAVTTDTLSIQFSQPLTNITFTFATADFPPIEIPTPIKLTAYTNSTGTPPVGSTLKRGSYGTDSLPMGTLSFASVGQPFNLVEIQIQAGGGTGVLVDNITVTPVGASLDTITTSSSPSAGGSTSGGGNYNSGANATVTATPNPGYAFVNWTESGTPVSSSASYTFTASVNRALVANFVLLQTLKLNIQAVGDTAVISWTTNSAGFGLQQNSDLTLTNWANATNTVSVVNTNNQVTVTPLTGKSFYRLFHP